MAVALRRPGQLRMDDGEEYVPREQRLATGETGSPADDVIVPQGPKPGSKIPASSQETPRERPPSVGPSSTLRPAQATPARPTVPTPMAGSSFQPPQGVQPFAPMAGPGAASLVKPASRGLYGGMGGLTGGGLGMPSDPTSNAASNPIDTLIQLLTLKRGR